MDKRDCRSAGILTATMLAVALVAACGDETTTPKGAAATDPATLTREEQIELRRKLQQDRTVARAAEEPSPPVTGEVPAELLDAVFADLEGRGSGPRSAFTVLRGEAVQWSDGSLGCGKPGEVYPQMIIDGYRIVIEVGGDAFDYRADASGNFKLCTGPGSLTRRLQELKKGPREGAPVE